jgi:hypothetical protein
MIVRLTDDWIEVQYVWNLSAPLDLKAEIPVSKATAKDYMTVARFPVGAKIFLLAIKSRTPLGPIQPLI